MEVGFIESTSSKIEIDSFGSAAEFVGKWSNILMMEAIGFFAFPK